MGRELDDQIAALRARIGAANDAELASALGVQRSAISQWKKRGRVPEKTERIVQRIEANRDAGEESSPRLAALSPVELELSRALAIAFISRYSGEDPKRLLHWSRQLNEVTLAAARLLRIRSAMGGVKGQKTIAAVYEHALTADRFFEHDLVECLVRT